MFDVGSNAYRTTLGSGSDRLTLGVTWSNVAEPPAQS
jgi:hypothetical protein